MSAATGGILQRSGAFWFGQGLYYPCSTIHFNNVVGIPLSLVGAALFADSSATLLMIESFLVSS